MITTLDESDLGSVAATVETDGRKHFALRLRPHNPEAYYRAQSHSVILTPNDLLAVVAMMKRQGLWPEEQSDDTT